MRLPTTGTSPVDAKAGKSSIFLDYISQARQQIQELEFFFSKQVYPAVESNLKDSESAVAELRSNFTKAQQLWLEEKQALTRDLEDAVLEKEAAIRSRESALRDKDSRVRELEKQLAEKQEAVEELERERASLQCDNRRVNRKNSKLEERWRDKSSILTSLNSRYMSMKRFLKNNGMSKRFEEYEQAQREMKCYGSDDDEEQQRAECLKISKVDEPAEPVWKVNDEVRHQAEPVRNMPEEHQQAEAVTKDREADPQAEPVWNWFMSDTTEHQEQAGAASEAVWKRSKADEEPHQRSKSDEPVSKTSKNDGAMPKRCKSEEGQAEPAPKRSKSRAEPEAGWRTTRAEGSTATDLDPHDDFLSTPQELALQRLAAALNSTEVLAVDEHRRPFEAPAKPGPRKAAPESARKQQQHGPLYKYVEPVRKKADREALQGVDCNQCRKFYEAVSAQDAQGAKRSRCEEHHDAVSRHRYKYAPPGTPEGFWDITFDTPS